MANEITISDAKITCKETTFIVSASRDGEASENEHRALNLHLRHCVKCQVAKRQFENLFDALI
jgi:Putative zinc-finger